MIRFLILCWGGLLLISTTLSFASAADLKTCVTDDLGGSVCASQVRRVVTLSPHATELIAYMGGANVLVGVDRTSNYPPSVRSLPVVGDSQRVDLERLVSLRPDLVVAWSSGTSPATIQALRDQAIPVFVSEPVSIQAVADNMVALGQLLGRKEAQSIAQDWVKQFDQLKVSSNHDQTVKVFYQVWENPLMTIGGRHLINDVIDLCGGVNVFGDLPTLAPTINIESVLALQPELIVTSGESQRALAGLSHWLEWGQLPAVQNKHLAVLPADVLVRNGPRLIDGARAMCDAIREARP